MSRVPPSRTTRPRPRPSESLDVDRLLRARNIARHLELPYADDLDRIVQRVQLQAELLQAEVIGEALYRVRPILADLYAPSMGNRLRDVERRLAVLG